MFRPAKMSDALALLRTFVKGKRVFHKKDDKIIFGDVFYYKNIKTTYLVYGKVGHNSTSNNFNP